jgi:perosamine synthetase
VELRLLGRISYVKPSITEIEISMATEAASFGWGENSNFYINNFEREFAAKVGSTNAIATSSCTGALHLGLRALDIGEGDEVILAETNWIATLAPLNYLGAKPVFVDIREDSWCIDTQHIREKITSKTKAIIATHLYGNLCDMDELSKIASEFNLLLIEDAAEAIGSFYKDKHAGTIADMGIFSFHGSKTLTTGEGGMLVTDNEFLAEKVSSLNNHGRRNGESRQFWPSSIGYKYKMTNMQAAIGIAQLSRFDELVARKREIFSYYADSLASYDEVRLNPTQEGCISGAWMPNVVFSIESGVTREELILNFQEANIDARVFFWPLSDLGFYETARNPISRKIASQSINLPSYHDMSTEDMDRVIRVIVETVAESRSRRGGD